MFASALSAITGKTVLVDAGGSSVEPQGPDLGYHGSAAVVLFCLAAVIEGFLSPSAAPYPVKAGVALVSSAILLFYVVVLGLRGRMIDAN